MTRGDIGPENRELTDPVEIERAFQMCEYIKQGMAHRDIGPSADSPKKRLHSIACASIGISGGCIRQAADIPGAETVAVQQHSSLVWSRSV